MAFPELFSNTQLSSSEITIKKNGAGVYFPVVPFVVR